MKIISAHDMGADGVELLVHLDEEKLVVGPDGEADLRPDPKWLWRTSVPTAQWQADQVAALQRVARHADREKARRTPSAFAELRGLSLDPYLIPDPAPTAPQPAAPDPVEDVD
jgi:hypothetical protein